MDLIEMIKENMVEDKCRLTNQGLSEGLDVSLSTIKRRLKVLVDKGDIRIEGGGKTRKITLPTEEKMAHYSFSNEISNIESTDMAQNIDKVIINQVATKGKLPFDGKILKQTFDRIMVEERDKNVDIKPDDLVDLVLDKVLNMFDNEDIIDAEVIRVMEEILKKRF